MVSCGLTALWWLGWAECACTIVAIISLLLNRCPISACILLVLLLIFIVVPSGIF